MPKHHTPKTVAQFFELHDITLPNKAPLWSKAIDAAFESGFRIGRAQEDEVVILTPEKHRKIYKGFGRARRLARPKLGLILTHAMFNSRLH